MPERGADLDEHFPASPPVEQLRVAISLCSLTPEPMKPGRLHPGDDVRGPKRQKGQKPVLTAEEAPAQLDRIEVVRGQPRVGKFEMGLLDENRLVRFQPVQPAIQSPARSMINAANTPAERTQKRQQADHPEQLHYRYERRAA
jgi:hypothetical protein